ncbi:phosphate ABC transporter ATP-binding protein [Dokdonia sp.]|uniref:phosphate ABC transporter ATP-binding protein n=1 Tax=Dokdonia sp. TaxID=2024995 RepID=UPI003265B4AF
MDIQTITHKNIQTDLGTVEISISNFSLAFHATKILKDISVHFYKNKVNTLIGPSGSGKSTLLRCMNRINNTTEGITTKGAILFNSKDIFKDNNDLSYLRKDIGMVFQRPCVFPKSILENVVFGIQHLKKLSKTDKLKIAEKHLKAVSLWNEVSDRLNEPASSLSIGQQQRLCIARAIAIEPKVILMDEPTSSLDPISSKTIENLIQSLKKQYTIILVTHNISQAQRISDQVTFICEGNIIETGSAEKLFNHPEKIQTKTYLSDNFCNC